MFPASLSHSLARVHARVTRVLLAAALLPFATLAMAADVSLAWDPVADPAVAGYTVHWGTAVGSYTSQADAGTATSRTLTGLADGTTYHIAVTAYDASGARSGYSNEVVATTPASAPVASFSASATSGSAPLSINFTSTSTGTITSYAWSFGDGTTSSVANPSKTYAAAGTYTVVLTVTGPGGSNTSTRSNYISVTAPSDTTAPSAPASLSANATGGSTIGLAWGAATDNVGVTGYRVERCQGSTCTSFAQIATPAGTTFSDSGLAAGTAYRYRVRATDAAGNLGPYSPIAAATTTAAPVASFTATPVSGTSPLTVTFTSTSTGTITSYAWSFGDGTTSSVVNPSKTYSSAGSYTVTLTVTGPGGSHAATRTSYIVVTAPPATLDSVGIIVDPASAAGSTANGNGIVEPGETVLVVPIWEMVAGGAVTVTASARVSGQSGSAFTLADAAAAYGTLEPGDMVDCQSATGNCYRVRVSSTVKRPVLKWGIQFTETLSTGASVTRTIPIGRTFSDVPPSYSFYTDVEALVWKDVTLGYADGTFQPDGTVTRAHTSMFTARAALGSGGDASLPTSGTVDTRSYSCSAGGVSLFSDVAPTDSMCAHVHFLAARRANVAYGCGGSNRACPQLATTRRAMSVVVAGTMAAGGDADVPIAGTFNDSGSARSYNCGVTGGSHFSDVPSSAAYCRHVNYLWARGIIDGYADGTFKPDVTLTRGQMAKFVTRAFRL